MFSLVESLSECVTPFPSQYSNWKDSTNENLITKFSDVWYSFIKE